MAKLFVSYSRRDSAAARRLIEAFKSMGQEVWVDWEAIPPAVDWLEQIFRGIEEADAFIFMISPDSIASEVCKVEVGRAVLNNKRIIPIVLRDVNPKDTLDDVRKLNWTFIRETDNFDEGLAKVQTAIELDLDWLEEHRRLQVRALEWHRRKDTSLLLYGRDLRNARHMVQTYTSKDPIPTDLQQKYIDHSLRNERNRTIAWIATAVAVVSLAILSYLTYNASVKALKSEAEAIVRREESVTQRAEALYQKQIADNNAALAIENQRKADQNAATAVAEKERADQQRLFAEAQRSAARAQIYQNRTGELYTSTLLAIDSWKKHPSDEAEEVLRRNISLLPGPVSQAKQDASISLLELSPDGETFLSVDIQGTLCLRSVRDEAGAYCPTDLSPVEDALFVQGGEGIAIVDAAGRVRVMNTATGEVNTEIDAGAPVSDIKVSPDGRTLAIGRADGRIIVIDIDEPITRADNLFLSGGSLSVLAFSPNGNWIAAGSERGSAAAWRLESNKSITLPPHRDGILSLAFSPNERFLITGGADNYAIGYDIQIEQEIFRLPHSDWVTDIDFPATDSEWFATASEDARVRVWELGTARERLVLFQDGPVRDVAISTNGQWIAATGDDETIRVWSAYSGVEMKQVPLKAQGVSVAFHPDDRLLVSGDEAGILATWDVSEMVAPVGTTEYAKQVWASKFTPAGDRLVAAEANWIRIIPEGNFSTLGAVALAGSVQGFTGDIRALVISPDSRTIGFSTSTGEIFIQDVQTRRSRPVNTTNEVTAFAFSPDGTRFLTASSQGILEAWEMTTGEQVKTLEWEGPILSLASSSKGLAIGLTDRIILLDEASGETIDELSSPGGNPFLAFDGDGSMLASANSSGQVQIWEAGNGGYEPRQLIEKGSAYALAFTSDGSTLAVAAVNDVFLIDTDIGEETGRIPHRGIVYDVSFSPEGALLATASQRMIQFWDVSDLQPLEKDELIEAACARLTENFSDSQWAGLFGA
ncbi:MAG TPA: TIR domain-containing protein, partial [Anaerolineales bacterium]|nr:TIR domain-containing protein [Anaerolineales bacterium]